MGSGRNIEILINARDNSAAGVDSARNRLEGLGKSVNTALKLGGIGGTIKGAFDLANAGAAAFRGDWEAAGEAVKSLPFGIGAIAQALEPVLAELTGARKEMEAMKTLADENARLNRQRDVVLKAQGEAKGLDRTLDNQIELLRTSSDSDRQRIAAEQTLRDEIAKTDALRKSLGDKDNGRSVNLRAQAITKFMLTEEKTEREEGVKLREAAVKEAQDRNEIEVRARMDEIEEARKWGKERIKVDSEIAEQRLRLAGKTLEAEREQTSRGFAERIAAARSAGQGGLAAEIEKERDLALRGLGLKKEGGRKGDEKLSMTESRFLSGRGSGGGNQVEKNTAAIARTQTHQLAELKLNTAAIMKIADALRGIAPVDV